ncbi:MAG: hypothetical protein V5A28_04935 [Haloarculaceae archaeon]
MSGDRPEGTSGDSHDGRQASDENDVGPGSEGRDGDPENDGNGGETGDRDDSRGDPPVSLSLSSATKSSLLWAAIGGLAFLVLVQGFELWSGQRVSVLVKFAVAAVVAAAAGATTHLLRGRLPAPNESA